MKFIKDVQKEMKKVRWLKKKKVLQQFVIINVVSMLILTYFGAIDFVVVGIKGLLN